MGIITRKADGWIDLWGWDFKFGFVGECDPCTFLSLSREKYQKSAT